VPSTQDPFWTPEMISSMSSAIQMPAHGLGPADDGVATSGLLSPVTNGHRSLDEPEGGRRGSKAMIEPSFVNCGSGIPESRMGDDRRICCGIKDPKSNGKCKRLQHIDARLFLAEHRLIAASVIPQALAANPPPTEETSCPDHELSGPPPCW
jgi:hypothetical protein